jgi:hypothetical protein
MKVEITGELLYQMNIHFYSTNDYVDYMNSLSDNNITNSLYFECFSTLYTQRQMKSLNNHLDLNDDTVKEFLEEFIPNLLKKDDISTRLKRQLEVLSRHAGLNKSV